MNLKPLGDRIVVQPTEQEEQTALGNFLPETAKEKPQQGRSHRRLSRRGRTPANASPWMCR